MASGEAAQRVFEVVIRPGWILGNESVASGVQVLDCRPLFSDGATSIWVEYSSTVASKILPMSEVEKKTPPAAIAMAPKPAGLHGLILEADRPFLAHSGAGGDMRVVRTSPPK